MKGAARFEAKFHDTMKAMTLRKFGSKKGARSRSASGMAGPARGIGGSGTCRR
ncbi:hypothetical protein D3C83_276040 [compost metagenome]